jgi:hypothetical protein
VLVELSFPGIEVDRLCIETVGQLIKTSAVLRMPDERSLALSQADETRTDFALLESHLEFISGQLSQVPTRAYLCRTLLVPTASVWGRSIC